MIDPRAALAEALRPLQGQADLVQRRLAERGVLLVTEDRLRQELQRAGIGSADWYAPRIFAALSGEPIIKVTTEGTPEEHERARAMGAALSGKDEAGEALEHAFYSDPEAME